MPRTRRSAKRTWAFDFKLSNTQARQNFRASMVRFWHGAHLDLDGVVMPSAITSAASRATISLRQRRSRAGVNLTAERLGRRCLWQHRRDIARRVPAAVMRAAASSAAAAVTCRNQWRPYSSSRLGRCRRQNLPSLARAGPPDLNYRSEDRRRCRRPGNPTRPRPGWSPK